ncbi:putative uncharacterized protein DDB_G0282499 isoform X2 [Daktulosphaira vitifoliae]|uniref:putative uncharacterized protein DDB_G0282499 isoform X2 n=1 Tax=Daktulosphaira vitifoliae TaxID=58002 RepID=UPI0021AAA658|nr:putative uncharacterized protein DDB_G0282499 isoform X2 [Daktulosphaira vitifoliae]
MRPQVPTINEKKLLDKQNSNKYITLINRKIDQRYAEETTDNLSCTQYDKTNENKLFMARQKRERARKNHLQLLQKQKELEERKKRLDNLKETTKKLAQASLKKKHLSPKFKSTQPEKNINEFSPKENIKDNSQRKIIKPETLFSKFEHFKNIKELINEKSFSSSNINFKKCDLINEKQNSERRIHAAKIIQQFYRKYKMIKQKNYDKTACNCIPNINVDLLDTNTAILNSNSSCCSMKDLNNNNNSSTIIEKPIITNNSLNSLHYTKYNHTIEHTNNSKYLSNKLKSSPMKFISILKCKQRLSKINRKTDFCDLGKNNYLVPTSNKPFSDDNDFKPRENTTRIQFSNTNPTYISKDSQYLEQYNKNQILNFDSSSNKEDVSSKYNYVFNSSKIVCDIKSTETNQNTSKFTLNDQFTTIKPSIIKSKFHGDLDNINCEIFIKKQYSNDYQYDQNLLINEKNNPMEDILSSEPLIKFYNELKAELEVFNNLNNYLANIENLTDRNLSKLEGD